jgi:stearoyl-CoA desaturase (delta-9 desaturase)
MLGEAYNFTGFGPHPSHRIMPDDSKLVHNRNASQRHRYGVQKSAPPGVVQLRIAVAAVGGALAPVLYPPTRALVMLFVVSYLVRMWATEAVYHRYFSHRAFRARRGVQFALALLGTQNGQRGPLWWASKHRLHHQSADLQDDPHSPNAHGFGYAFIGWLWDRRSSDTDLDAIPDYARFAELRWLNQYYAIPFYGGGALLVAAAHLGWLGSGITGGAALLWGFFLPVTATLLGVALVNSLCHMPQIPGGFRRYDTADRSVNRPLLALATLGGGWHTNHHRYAAPARAGFARWEVDPVYYVLRALQAMRIVHDVKGSLPDDVLRDGRIAPPRS